MFSGNVDSIKKDPQIIDVLWFMLILYKKNPQIIDVLWLVNCWPSLSGRKETKAGSKFIIQQEIRRGRPFNDDDVG